MPTTAKVSHTFGGYVFECWLEYTISDPNPDQLVVVNWDLHGSNGVHPNNSYGSGPSGYIQGSVGPAPTFAFDETHDQAVATEQIYVLHNYTPGNLPKRIIAVVRVGSEVGGDSSDYYSQEIRYFMRREKQNSVGGVFVVDIDGPDAPAGYSDTKILRPRVEKTAV